jgi:hypothetical protein
VELTGVSLPFGITSIGGQAFGYCNKLAAMAIPQGVTSIGDYAFYYCTGLRSLTIPASTVSIGMSAFDVCSSLPSIMVDPANPNFSSRGGVLFNKHGTTLIQCPAGVTGTYVIPSTVKTLADFAFGDCVGLTGVTIPNGVTSIGGWAFYDCTKLTGITIPSSVTSIGKDAFFRCYALKRAVFRGDAPTMEDGVFDLAASGFTVYYMYGKAGFSSPKWHGYPARIATPELVLYGPGGSMLGDGAAAGFGKIALGASSPVRTFKLRNEGPALLSGLAITISGTNKADFKAGPLGTDHLSPGASTTFTVRFKPGAAGSRTAVIHIASNDVSRNPYDVHLTGTGVEASPGIRE